MLEPRTLELPYPVEEIERLLHITTVAGHELVAIIEVLSPSNKRRSGDGRAEYLRARRAALATTAHLVEIDLLRGGSPLPTRPRLPDGEMSVLVSPGNLRRKTFAYSVPLRGPLPTIPIPLREPDPPVPLDLQAAYAAIYEDLGFDLALDRSVALEPPLPAEDAAWVAECLAAVPAA